jgi:glycosyltransferase involved in cell wall biosynthesis
MRIVYVAPRASPAVGGMETFLRHLTQALAERHDVLVLAQGIDSAPRSQLADSLRPPPTFEPFDDGGVRVEPIRVPASRRAMLAPLVSQVTPGLRRYAYGRPRIAAGALYARAVGPVLAEALDGADVVHVWGGDMLGAATVAAARRRGIPVVATPFVHERQWGDDASFAWTYRRLDRVLALLESDAAVYERLGVPRDRIEITGVCSPGVTSSLGPALRALHDIEGLLVVYLGVRRPYKGFDLLLEAAPKVPGATFAFLGPGPALPEIQGARVIDAGHVDDAMRAAWLAAADVLCLPSEAEIFPVSILEAWSVGTPVVTSDIAPLQELMRRSGGGVACARDAATLASTLSELAAEPERLHALGASGRAFWEASFTVDAVAARHESLYEELVEAQLCVA